MLGTHTLEVEISLVSNKGFWLFFESEELFVPYSEFPWFKEAQIEEIMTIENPTKNHLYWPLLDIDLSVDSIRNPEAFPLISRSNPSLQHSGVRGNHLT